MSFSYKIVTPVLLLAVLAGGVFYITDGFKKISPIMLGSSLSNFSAANQPAASARPGSVDQVCFKKKCFVVELAQTMAEQSRGLMFRDHLDSDKGMLFVFDSSAIYNFWMKNTEIPLDIIWLDKNGRIVFISANIQPCRQDICPTIKPDWPAKYVLEINGGLAQSLGLTVGSWAEIKFKR